MPRDDLRHMPDVEVRRRVERLYRAIDERDYPTMASVFAPRATYWRPGYPPIVGRAAMELFQREREVQSGRHTLECILVSRDEVAVRGRFEGEFMTGRRTSHRFGEFFDIGPDGLFEARTSFFFAPLVAEF
jgi:ketosteroid isomerase-like protein